jgi:DNA-binding phage protein
VIRNRVMIEPVDLQTARPVPVDHGAWMEQKLQNLQFAVAYLHAASEDEDPRVFITALRQVVKARGNPTAKTLTAVLGATGP